MSKPIIEVHELSKQYRLGVIGATTLRDSFDRWWQRLRRNGSSPESPSPDTCHPSPDTCHLTPDMIWALKDVSFTVEPGEVVGIIGRNGAGKSTLLKILSRITEPSCGFATLRGRVASLLEVGTGFHPELTGRENIYLNGAILGMKKAEIERKFDEIVAFAEIEKFMDTPVKRYSSGMYVRLAFAVAAHLEPEILVVDEVLAVGDIDFQKKCLGKMRDVAEAGRTVLFVSHNIPAIQRLCPRTILLDAGRLCKDGDTNAVVSNYLAAGTERIGQRVWRDRQAAPGDDVVRLRAIRALDHKAQVDSKFSVLDAWFLEVEFDVLVPGQNVNVNLYIYDAYGALLFVAGDFQTAEWQNRPRPVGVHRSRCCVPRDLLNEGTVRILVGLVTPPATLRALDENALMVSIIDDLSPSGARGYYPANWPGGAVRPLLRWEYEYKAAL